MDPLRGSLRDTFADHQPSPSQEVWSRGIEPNIKRRRRAIGLWTSTAMLAVAAALALLLWFRNDSQQAPATTNPIAAQSPQPKSPAQAVVPSTPAQAVGPEAPAPPAAEVDVSRKVAASRSPSLDRPQVRPQIQAVRIPDLPLQVTKTATVPNEVATRPVAVKIDALTDDIPQAQLAVSAPYLHRIVARDRTPSPKAEEVDRSRRIQFEEPEGLLGYVAMELIEREPQSQLKNWWREQIDPHVRDLRVGPFRLNRKSASNQDG